MTKVFTSPRGKAISHQAGWYSLPRQRLLPLWIARIVNVVLDIAYWIAQLAMILFLLGCMCACAYAILG